MDDSKENEHVTNDIIPSVPLVSSVPQLPADLPAEVSSTINNAIDNMGGMAGLMGMMSGMTTGSNSGGSMAASKPSKTSAGAAGDVYDKDVSILIATPAFNNLMCSSHSISIKNFQLQCQQREIKASHAYIYNESLITRARNTLCDMFIKNKEYTHLLFIDADIEFESEDIFKMLEYNQPIVGGAYPKKTILWDKVLEMVNENHKSYVSIDEVKKASRDYVCVAKDDDQSVLNADFEEVKYTGTGIMLIQRQVLERMMEAHPDEKYIIDCNTYFRFFDVGLKWIGSINKNIYLSEDYWFCERWRELGGKIYLYTKMRCQHWGSMAY